MNNYNFEHKNKYLIYRDQSDQLCKTKHEINAQSKSVLLLIINLLPRIPHLNQHRLQLHYLHLPRFL